MINVDQAIVAKLKIHDQNFEILVECNGALALRSGKDIDVRSILAAQKIFSDAKKGLEAPENAMKSIFGTKDTLEIAKIIIKKGDIPLTTEYKEKLREEKKKKIIDIIHRNAVDPKTHAPHPPQRIENALLEAKVHIDEFQDVQRQVQEIIKKIRPILPIKFEVKEIAVKIPPDYAVKSYSTVKQFGKILREDWQTEGSWVAVIEIPGGLENDLYDKINKLTHGNVETKVLKVR